MDKERLEQPVKTDSKPPNQGKDWRETVKIITPIAIPLIISIATLWFQSNYNHSQLQLQRMKDSTQLVLQQRNDSNQRRIANINAQLGQSALIKDFLPLITSENALERNVAYEAILYAVPGPGKRMLDLRIKYGTKEERKNLTEAVDNRRDEVVNNLFSYDKGIRLLADNELSLNWLNDILIIGKLINKASNCYKLLETGFDCQQGPYNALVALTYFSRDNLLHYQIEIRNLVKLIPENQAPTTKLGAILIAKLEGKKG